jgi:hypothetical protein
LSIDKASSVPIVPQPIIPILLCICSSNEIQSIKIPLVDTIIIVMVMIVSLARKHYNSITITVFRYAQVSVDQEISFFQTA